MNACATALRTGVPFTIHSDAPVTPLGPLFTAWAAVNWPTASGRVLGARAHRRGAGAARHHHGAAWTLKLDHDRQHRNAASGPTSACCTTTPRTWTRPGARDVRVWGHGAGRARVRGLSVGPPFHPERISLRVFPGLCRAKTAVAVQDNCAAS